MKLGDNLDETGAMHIPSEPKAPEQYRQGEALLVRHPIVECCGERGCWVSGLSGAEFRVMINALDRRRREEVFAVKNPQEGQ